MQPLGQNYFEGLSIDDTHDSTSSPLLHVHASPCDPDPVSRVDNTRGHSNCSVKDPEGSFELLVVLEFPKVTVQALALYDPGASSLFINNSLVKQHNIPTYPIPPRPIYTIDGTPIQGGGTKSKATGLLGIDGHVTKEDFYVSEVGRHDVVLGITWIRKHAPQIEWSRTAADRMVFSSRHCSEFCLPTPIDAYGID